MEVSQLHNQPGIPRVASDPEFSTYAVMRTAGVSPTGFHKLVFRATLAIVDLSLDLEASCRREASSLPSVLERTIGAISSREVSRELIQLRRDIFNDRLPKRELTAQANATLAEALSSSEWESLANWLTSRRRRDVLAREGESVFAAELSAKRTLLKRLFRKREFRKGLALASADLSRELDQYVQTDGNQSVTRVRRTERSLMRYYSRSALKLSPFSSFTRTGALRVLQGDQHTSQVSKPSGRRIRRSVAVNRALIGYVAHRVAKHPELGGHVPIFISRALAPKNGSMLALRHRYKDLAVPVRLRVPEEGLVLIRRTRAIDWVENFFRNVVGTVGRQQLVSALSDSLGGAAQAADYVSALVDAGFLIHRVPLPEDNSSGLEALIAFLSTITSPVAAAVRHPLHQLQSLASQFAGAPHGARPDLMGAMESLVAEALSALGVEEKFSWTGLLLFEDCIEEPIGAVSIVEADLETLRDLKEFVVTYLGLLDGNASARETIRHILCTECAGGPISFLHFARKYKDVCFPAGGVRPDLEDEFTPNVCGLDALSRLAKLRRELSAVVTRSDDAEEIDLARVAKEKSWQERVRDIGLAPSIGSIACFSCYCQPVASPDGESRLILNKVHGGPARVALRFCNGLRNGQDRSRLVRDVRQLLRRSWRQIEPCEVLARFDFNVNLCPPVTERFIDYANAPTSAAEAIQLCDLSLRFASDGRIVLTDERSQREIAPITFGMMATPFEPPVEYLLLSLCGADPMMYQPFDPYSWHVQSSQQGPVARFPRLTFGRCIVRRRGWSVLREALPQRERNDSDFQYFMRVRRWQREIGLPDEVFMRARTREESLGGSRSGRRGRNLHKPQYVHFGNHFLLDVMTDLFYETTSQLYIEEMLPDWKSLEHWKLPRPVEFVLDVFVDATDRASATLGACESTNTPCAVC